MKTKTKIIQKIHLYIGLTSGLLVCFLGITGCILAFQSEIETLTQEYRFVEKQQKPYLNPSILKEKAAQLLPGKIAHSVIYEQPGNAAQVSFYNVDPEYYYVAFMNPYNGELLKLKNMDDDFFRIVLDGHFYLWLPPNIGQPIVSYGTLLFVIMLITGLILWWPKKKNVRKQRFTIKLSSRWRRLNYDLHSVLGFYALFLALILGLTGMSFGLQWVRSSVHWAFSGGESHKEYMQPPSVLTAANQSASAPDKIYAYMLKQHPNARLLEIHFPEDKTTSISANANYGEGTYWKTDFRYFDQYTLKELSVNHSFGRLKDAGLADLVARMNYDIHIGAIGGLAGKIIAFLVSFLCASMPVTGFLIWYGRKNKPLRKSSIAIHRIRTKSLLQQPLSTVE